MLRHQNDQKDQMHITDRVALLPAAAACAAAAHGIGIGENAEDSCEDVMVHHGNLQVLTNSPPLPLTQRISNQEFIRAYVIARPRSCLVEEENFHAQDRRDFVRPGLGEIEVRLAVRIQSKHVV